MRTKIFKEISCILAFCALLALVYNYFSQSGLNLIRKEKEIKWAKDSTINAEILNYKKISETAMEVQSTTIDNKQRREEYKTEPKSKISLAKEVIPDVKPVEKEKVIKDTVKPVAGIDSPSIPQKEQIPEKIEPVAITIEQAYKIYTSTDALFIDARIEADYQSGHIKGAISIPFKKYEQYKYKLDGVGRKHLIVSYCDGRGCDESIDLAKKLIEADFINVKIFYGGWVDWIENNYPIEK